MNLLLFHRSLCVEIHLDSSALFILRTRENDGLQVIGVPTTHQVFIFQVSSPLVHVDHVLPVDFFLHKRSYSLLFLIL